MKVVISVLFIAICATLWIFRGYVHFGQQLQLIKHDVVYKEDTASHWRDEYNREHAKNISLVEDRSTAEILHSKEISQAASAVHAKDKQIEGLQRLLTDVKGQFTADIDTVRHGEITKQFNYADSFSKFSGKEVANKEIMQYDIRVPVILNAYWKRPHEIIGIGFGKREHYIDGYSTNPNVHIDSLSNIRILQKEPGRFGIGPYAGIATDGLSIRPSVGIALTFSLIRF